MFHCATLHRARSRCGAAHRLRALRAEGCRRRGVAVEGDRLPHWYNLDIVLTDDFPRA